MDKKETKINNGRFKKGRISPNKGKKMPEYLRVKLLGHPVSEETRKKQSLAWEKRRLRGISAETREKMSLAHKGKIVWNYRKKMLQTTGEKNTNWKGGITPINIKIRKSLEYKLWRTAVFERDNYTCIWCGQRGKELNADHIKPFCLFPELRFAIDNGRTLCVPCHRKTNTFGWKATINNLKA